MATAPAPSPDPRTRVRSSHRLWSEEVAQADPPDTVDNSEKAYEFTKPGRTFVERDRTRYNGGNGNS